MLKKCVFAFVQEELGGGTIMGLFWFMLMVGITGMAVDATNGFRNRTMLQATADSAVLAAVIDLPDGAAASASAITNSLNNMSGEQYGQVLQAGDVEIGAWDNAGRGFTVGGTAPNPLDPTGPWLPNSVRVTLHQTAANGNAVPVNLLRIAGLYTWDVNVQAVAQRYLPDCLNDGLIARGMVDISSNNAFVNNICIHGQQGVEMQNHNYHESGVNVSMPDMDNQLVIPTGGMTSNPGLPQALREQSFDPRMVNHVNEIMADILTKEAYVLPTFINAAWPVVDVNANYVFLTSSVVPGTIYHVVCAPNKNVSIKNNTVLVNVAIIADCGISVGSGATLINVVLGSTALGNGSRPRDNANINFS